MCQIEALKGKEEDIQWTLLSKSIFLNKKYDIH